jgi:hypothetical protein
MENAEVVEMSPEQAADLAALKMAAGGEAAPVAEVEAAPEGPQLDQEIAGLVLAFVAIAKPILPSLSEIYTEETTGQAAAVVANLCRKHGWLQGGIMGDYAEEVAAAVVLLPLGVATHNGIKSDIEARRLRDQYLRQKKQADLTQHMNIAHNLDGKTEPVSDGAAPDASLQGWQPPSGGASANG